MIVKRYGLNINLYDCKEDFSKKNILKYVKELCKLINMKRHGKIVIWKDSHNEILELRGGISAFQFIKTSSIVLHSFEKSKQFFVDIFSCKDFDFKKTIKFTKDFFKSEKIKVKEIKN